MIVGIDIGGTTTKIVGSVEKGRLLRATVRASDPVASAAGAVGRFLADAGLHISDISRLAVTGVGASFLEADILGIEAFHVDEFRAVGLGGLFLSGEDRALVASVGTGTAFVHADGQEVRHVGGSGVGGGTIIGLCKRLSGVSDIEALMELTANGRIEAVDLTIGDIMKGKLGKLSESVTASNFGKAGDLATPADWASGVVNMVFQTVGMIAIMAARAEKDPIIVFVGNSMRLPQVPAVIAGLESLYDVRIVVPELAEYATALGAALTLLSGSGIKAK